jgi:hypothetical protein
MQPTELRKACRNCKMPIEKSKIRLQNYMLSQPSNTARCERLAQQQELLKTDAQNFAMLRLTMSQAPITSLVSTIVF